MRVIEQTIYQFDELSDKAKETARGYFRDLDYAWSSEAKQSIETFCSAFDVSLLSFCVEAYSPFNYKTDASNANFRGKKLSQFNRDYMVNGYCWDNELWMTFYDVFRDTGDAKYAFNAALDECFRAWRKDMEYQTTNEYIDEFIIGSESEFYENGKMF